MRNKIIYSFLIFWLLILTGCSEYKKKENDLSQIQLKGNVKSISTIVYNSKHSVDRIVSHEPDMSYEFPPKMKFNREGKIVEREDFNYKSFNRLNLKTIYEYDEDGHLKEISNYDEQGNLEYKSVFDSGFNGKPIKSQKFFKNKIENLTTYTYDKDDNLIKVFTEFPDSETSTTAIYDYDSRGNIISFEFINETGENAGNQKIEYNSSDKISAQINYNQNGDVYEKFIYKYDSGGNLNSREQYVGGLLNTVAYFEAKNGLETRMEVRNKGEENLKWTYKYQFDEKGNWIERVKSLSKLNESSGEPQEIIKREITYYNEI